MKRGKMMEFTIRILEERLSQKEKDLEMMGEFSSDDVLIKTKQQITELKNAIDFLKGENC
jgi:hypothetical protein